MTDTGTDSMRPAISFLPGTAVLEMTYSCNHRCMFCSCPWERADGNFTKEPELDAVQWKEIIRKVSSMGVTDLCFTGGEALLRGDLWELAEFARSLNDSKVVAVDKKLEIKNEGLRLYLISNGCAVNLETLKLCKKHGVQISLSLPGLKTFPRLTGGGDPDKVLKAFADAKSLGLFTVANITVTKINLPELYETIAAAFLAGADQLLMNVFLKGGRGLKHSDELALTRDEIVAALNIAEQVLETSGRFGSVGTELPKCLLGGKQYKRLEVASTCSAGVGFFVIDPSGYIRVCNHSQVRLCHYRDIEQLKANPYWRTFTQKEYLPKQCLPCGQSGDCDGGCREEAHIVSGAVDAQNELCRTMCGGNV